MLYKHDISALNKELISVVPGTNTRETFPKFQHRLPSLMDSKFKFGNTKQNDMKRKNENGNHLRKINLQVVDMRWGVRDEATDDHMTTELCMREIENCQRLSMGPNFVVRNNSQGRAIFIFSIQGTVQDSV